METRTITDTSGSGEQFEAYIKTGSCVKCGAQIEIAVDKQLADMSGSPETYVESEYKLMSTACCGEDRGVGAGWRHGAHGEPATGVISP